MCFVFVQLYGCAMPLTSGNHDESDGGASGVRLVDCNTDVVTGALLPPACLNWTFTGPTPHTHHTVRTPLPYGSPIAPPDCVMSERTFAATTGSGNAGTV